MIWGNFSHTVKFDKISENLPFKPFQGISGKIVWMNKTFVYEKYICLPNFIPIEQKLK